MLKTEQCVGTAHGVTSRRKRPRLATRMARVFEKRLERILQSILRGVGGGEGVDIVDLLSIMVGLLYPLDLA